jgi:hypothetical protein
VLVAQERQPGGRAPLLDWKIAQRLDAGRVVIMLSSDDVELKSRTEVNAVVGERLPGKPLAGFLGDVSKAPPEWVRATTGVNANAGDKWAIDGGRAGWFTATVDGFVVTPSCQFAGAVNAEVDGERRDVFERVREKYFPARALSGWTPETRATRVGPISYVVTAETRTAIERLLRLEFAKKSDGVLSLFNQPSDSSLRNRIASSYRRISAGDGTIRLDVQAFRLTPDGMPRLFVRTTWRIGNQTVYLMSAWMRTSPDLAVEQSDNNAARAPWFHEFRYSSLDPPMNGRVLNVSDIDRDGTAELLMLYSGYESYSLELWKYPPAPSSGRKVLASFGAGC